MRRRGPSSTRSRYHSPATLPGLLTELLLIAYEPCSCSLLRCADESWKSSRNTARAVKKSGRGALGGISIVAQQSAQSGERRFLIDYQRSSATPLQRWPPKGPHR